MVDPVTPKEISRDEAVRKKSDVSKRTAQIASPFWHIDISQWGFFACFTTFHQTMSLLKAPPSNQGFLLLKTPRLQIPSGPPPSRTGSSLFKPGDPHTNRQRGPRDRGLKSFPGVAVFMFLSRPFALKLKYSCGDSTIVCVCVCVCVCMCVCVSPVCVPN